MLSRGYCSKGARGRKPGKHKRLNLQEVRAIDSSPELYQYDTTRPEQIEGSG